MTQIQVGFDEKIAPMLVAEIQAKLGSDFEVEVRLVKPLSSKISMRIIHLPLKKVQGCISPIWIGSEPVKPSDAKRPIVRAIVMKDERGQPIKVGDVRVDGKIRLTDKLIQVVIIKAHMALDSAIKMQFDMVTIERFAQKHKGLGIIRTVSKGEGIDHCRKTVSHEGLVDVKILPDDMGIVGIKMTALSMTLKQSILMAITSVGLGEDLKVTQFDTIMDELVFTGKLDKIGLALEQLGKIGLTSADIKPAWG